MSQTAPKRKIVVLGGGAGALAATYGLTQNPDWKDQYEITVYQMGWRLGGKGASGRNGDRNQRIEEHGLHLWGGWYWNSFRLMKSCYEEYASLLPPDAIIRSIDDAFLPLTQYTLMEQVGSEWHKWDAKFPFTDARPWDHNCEPPTLWQSFEQTLEWMLHEFTHSAALEVSAIEAAVASIPSRIASAARSIGESIVRVWGWVMSGFSTWPADASPSRHALLHEALGHIRADKTPPKPGDARHSRLSEILGLLKNWLDDLGTEARLANTELRHLYVNLDLAVCVLIGLLRDGVFTHGLNQINDIEYKDWMIKNGVSRVTLASPAFRSVYDYAFAFLDGDKSKPTIAAGTVIEIINRSCFHYRGAISWRMRAGMGDTIFSPIYRVLKERGVKFEFFHRVRQLNLSEDGKQIGSIDMGKQVNLKAPEKGYQPLCYIKGVECWPSQPFYDQIEDDQAQELIREKIDLESAWSPWNSSRETPLTLRQGVDFDTVVLGISIAALADVCKPLVEASHAWSTMIREVRTVQTQAVQLWLNKSAADLGWNYQLPLSIGYVESLDTYADMSHLLDREEWTGEQPPKSVAYFCGTFQDASVIPPFSDHGFPQTELEREASESIHWLETNSRAILFDPSHAPPNPQNDIWTLVDDPQAPATVARFATQYHRANINPTERYVLSVPGSYRSRMRVDTSGFTNLFLAGDWVTTQINAGCVEAAVTAGLLASQAICGFPTEIIDAY